MNFSAEPTLWSTNTSSITVIVIGQKKSSTTDMMSTYELFSPRSYFSLLFFYITVFFLFQLVFSSNSFQFFLLMISLFFLLCYCYHSILINQFSGFLQMYKNIYNIEKSHYYTKSFLDYYQNYFCIIGTFPPDFQA